MRVTARFTIAGRPLPARPVALAMLTTSILGVLAVFSAPSSLLTLSAAIFWLDEDAASVDVDVRARARYATRAAAAELAVCLVPLLLIARRSSDGDDVNFFFWLLLTSFLSLIFSITNLIWACFNHRKLAEVAAFDASSPADYSALRAEQLAGRVDPGGAAAEPLRALPFNPPPAAVHASESDALLAPSAPKVLAP